MEPEYNGCPDNPLQEREARLAALFDACYPRIARYALARIGEVASLGLLTGVGLPMVARSEVVGLIFILRGYGGQFSSNDRALLSSFAVLSRLY